jgi:hypothetical protein
MTETELKLYHPVHGYYYLAAACLVCQMPGLPDRRVETARGERAGFILRRLSPPANDSSRPMNEWDESAWLGSSWVQLNSVNELAENEELLPMSGTTFSGDDLRQRRIFAGLIPVAKRETYLGSPASAAPASVVDILKRVGIEGNQFSTISQAAAVAPDRRREGCFALRCAYERPACKALRGDVIGARSVPFQFASFYQSP